MQNFPDGKALGTFSLITSSMNNWLVVTKAAATTFGDLSLSSSGFAVDVKGEYSQTYSKASVLGDFRFPTRNWPLLLKEFFFFD